MQGCCSTTKALQAEGEGGGLRAAPSHPQPPFPLTLCPPPLQQAGELLLQPLLQQRQLGLQWVLLVGHLLSQLSHCPQQLQQLEEPLAQCREPAGGGGQQSMAPPPTSPQPPQPAPTSPAAAAGRYQWGLPGSCAAASHATRSAPAAGSPAGSHCAPAAAESAPPPPAGTPGLSGGHIAAVPPPPQPGSALAHPSLPVQGLQLGLECLDVLCVLRVVGVVLACSSGVGV